MKLIITQTNLTLFGGAEKVLLKIAQHYDAKIYTAEYNPATTFPEFKDLDVEVIKKSGLSKVLPYGRVAQGLSYGLGFYNLKIKEDYDVLNPHLAPSHWVRNNNDRVLWYCHTPLRDAWDLYEYRMALKKFYQKPIHAAGINVVRRLDKEVVKNIEFIFANSKNTKSRLIKYFGRRDAKVLNGGVDYKDYSNKGDEKYFFYPSRISPNKRQLYAIKAFEMFKRKKKGYKLLISGPVSKDKFFYDYYLKVVQEASRVGDVTVMQDVSDKKLLDLYSKSTAVLYTPINEDYGLVPLDAMASAKAIISVNEGGPRETIIENKTGFLVNNEKEMANKMLFVAEHPAFAKQMGKNGIRRVKEHYSWNNFFEKFDKAAREVRSL